MANQGYDFSRCKLCGEHGAEPRYRLRSSTIYVCAHCEFHCIDHLDDMPAPEDAGGSKTLDQRAWDFIESRLPANSAQHRKNLALVLEQGAVAGEQCLDVGAGAGVFARLLADAGASVTGIEPQSIFREFARKKFGIDLRGETIDHAYWQEGYPRHFGVITLWDVLEHVNFPAETLADAFKVARPGCWLFLDTPCRDSVFYRLSELAYRLSGGTNRMLLDSLYSSQPFHHKQIFTRKQLMGLVERIGWTVVRKTSSPFTLQNKIVLACRKQDA